VDLLTDSIRQALLSNGRASRCTAEGTEPERDLTPVAKLFTPGAACTWLLCELDSDDPDIAFGLCDLGAGRPEIGTVRISEIMNGSSTGGLVVERDQFFVPTMTLGEYAREAWSKGRISA